MQEETGEQESGRKALAVAEAHHSETVVRGYPGTIHTPPALKHLISRQKNNYSTNIGSEWANCSLRSTFLFLAKYTGPPYLFRWTYLLNTIRIY